MDEFFERRRRDNEKAESRMSALGVKGVRDRREAMKSHPVPGMSSRSAAVFVWEAHDATGTRPVRRPVSREEATEVFLDHSDTTRRFDPFKNEWDCYKGWDPKYQSDEAQELEYMYGPDTDSPMLEISLDATLNKASSPDNQPLATTPLLAPEPPISTTVALPPPESQPLEMNFLLAPPPSAAHAPNVSSSDHQPLKTNFLELPASTSPAPPPATYEAPLCIGRDDMESLQASLFFRYGFCGQGKDDFPFSTKALEYGFCTLDKVQRIYATHGESLPTSYHMPLIDFTYILIDNYRLGNGDNDALRNSQGQPTSLGGLWDLSADTTDRLPLPVSGAVNSSSISIRTIRCSATNRTLYTFRLPPDSDPKLPFTLTVEHASTAVECYRRRWHTVLDAIKHLTQCGKAFRTYTERSSLYREPQKLRPLRPLGFREASYTFRYEDYTAYEDELKTFLGQPFGRAAPLMGDIIWRLSTDVIGSDVAMLGPSSSAQEYGDVVTAPNGLQFVDDTLSQEEMDFICGKYIVYTGKLHIYVFFLIIS
jgi:hypothetical protein